MSTPTQTAPTRAGSWMQTYSGGQFWPLDPRPDEVTATDIAHALSMQCRYNGMSRRFLSVAEHCVLMSLAVSPANALPALLHDATEAYVGDMIRPLKAHMPDYVAVEHQVAWAIGERFGISPVLPGEVAEADTRILLDERAAVMADSPLPWGMEHLAPLGVEIRCWSPQEAEHAYLARLAELTTEAGR